MEKPIEESYSPYCPICDACGEDGCCSAMSCKQHPDGRYCQTYLNELRFGYLMFKEMYEMICDDPNYKEKLEVMYDKNYDRIWDTEIT